MNWLPSRFGRKKQNSTPASGEGEEPAFGTGQIDVRKLMAELSVEELCQTAEEYFAQLNDWTYLLSKPFGLADEVPHLLVRFSALLQGLKLGPNMTVLDFGAGPGWASRYLCQLGCHVISTDVSPTALRIGQELFSRLPPFGDPPPPRFLQFDGHRLDLPEGAVDRVFCLDAFHHVPNPAQVLAEMSRVLADGGVAGFAEPGPHHSLSHASQSEMRNFKVVENDVRIDEIWKDAQKAGFTDIRLGVIHVPPFHLGLSEFQDFLEGGATLRSYAEAVRGYMQEHRLFFLYKGDLILDSRQQEGLAAALTVEKASITAVAGGSVTLGITNTGTAHWRTAEGEVGSVHLGCHLYDAEGRQIVVDYLREPLLPGEARPILPGETVRREVRVPALPAGRHSLGFDLVSAGVCWFGPSGKSVEQRVDVVDS